MIVAVLEAFLTQVWVLRNVSVTVPTGRWDAGEAVPVWNELRTAPECQVLALAVVRGHDPKMEVAQVCRAARIERPLTERYGKVPMLGPLVTGVIPDLT